MTSRAVFKATGSLVLGALLFSPAARPQLIMDVEAQLRVEWLNMKRNMPQHPDPAVRRFAECIAWAIIDVIPEEFQGLDWEILVFDNDAQNAMVTPAGKIAVFSGLFDVADTPDKFAAVIGHEVAHLTEGHVGERVGRGILSTATGMVLGAAGSRVLGGNVRGEAQTATQIGIQLPFQRNQEAEADFTGMRFMAEAGYNPGTVLELWRAMGGERGPGQNRRRQPEWLSTHPDPSLRMREMASNLAPALVAYNNALDAGVRPRCRL